MSTKKKEKVHTEQENLQDTEVQASDTETTKDKVITDETTSEFPETEALKEEQGGSEEEKLRNEVNELNNKYLRLSAEFDNYRKRTLKEKIEMTKTAGEEILINILPVMDNFERAMKAMEKSTDIEAIKEGISLIYIKFKEFLTQKGIKEIDAINLSLNTDLHDAVTQIPAPSEELKGKIVDIIEKGYYLYDKVVRHSKVVVGE